LCRHFLFGDTTLPSGTDPSQIAANLSFDTRHYSPGWITFSVSCPSGASNSANVAFVGNQNTLALSAGGEMYQLDQAQGAPAGQNGFVRTFNPNGTGQGSFLVGALANGIAFGDTTGQVLVSYPGGPVVMYDPTTGTSTITRPMRFGRSVHEATLLASGRVLVSGGSEIRKTPRRVIHNWISAVTFRKGVGRLQEVFGLELRRRSHLTQLPRRARTSPISRAVMQTRCCARRKRKLMKILAACHRNFHCLVPTSLPGHSIALM